MPDIKLAQLGDLGGAIGAALLAERTLAKRSTRTRRRPAAATS
jgi:hypothetical protein